MKTALCFIGVVGGIEGKNGRGPNEEVLDISYKYFKKNILDINKDVDVFVHTWSVDYKDKIEQLFRPVKSVYEPQKFFDIPPHVKGSPERKNNHYSRWYSYKKVAELVKQHVKETNQKYKWTMVSRFDIAMLHPVVFSQYDLGKFYAGRWCRMYHKNGAPVKNSEYYSMDDVSSLRHEHVGYPHNDEGLIDQWFFSNSKYMDRFCQLFDSIDSYTKPGICPNDSAGNISNHQLALYHLKKLKLLKKLKFTMHLHDDFPLIRRWHFKSLK